MEVKDIMTRDVEVVTPGATLQEAARKMRDLDVGSVPVCDGRRLKGILTDRDITIRATAEGLDPTEKTVQETMTEEVAYCYENTSLEEAALLMMEKQIRRLPVVNQNHDLVGIISLGDIAEDVDDKEIPGETLEEISRPSEPDR
jgi:CBS domain-containing protein